MDEHELPPGAATGGTTASSAKLDGWQQPRSSQELESRISTYEPCSKSSKDSCTLCRGRRRLLSTANKNEYPPGEQRVGIVKGSQKEKERKQQWLQHFARHHDCCQGSRRMSMLGIIFTTTSPHHTARYAEALPVAPAPIWLHDPPEVFPGSAPI